MKKKITMLFAALLACVGVMKAQPEVGKMYRIKDDTRSKYLTIRSYNATSNGEFGTVPVLEKSEGDKDQIWYLEDAGESKYYLKSKSNYYLVCRGWCVDAVNTGGKSAISLEPIDLSFYIKNGTSYFKVEDIASDSGTSHPFCDAGAGHANIVTWTFEEVDESEFANSISVTYEYWIGENKYATSDPVSQLKNSEANAPALPFVEIVSYESTIGEEDCTVKVNCTENLPFTVTASLENPVWQLVEMHRNASFRVWDYVANDAAVNVTELSAAKECVLDDSKLWAFTGSLIDGFKIYNKLAGTSVTLNATATNPKVGVADNGNDVWKLVQSTANFDATVAWCFTNNGTDYMNRNGEGQIAYYGNADNGSTMYSYDLSELPQMVIDAASMVLNIPEGAVGSYLIAEDVLADLNAKTEAAKADVANFEKAQALSAAVKVAKESDQVAYADGYYRIFSAQPGLYTNSKGVIYDTADGKFKWNTVANDNVNAIVKLSTVEGKVVMQNANSNRYMQGVLGASNTNQGTSSGITLVALGGAQYNLNFGNGTMHAGGHGNGAGAGSEFVNYGGGYGSASAWYLFPATELEVALSEVEGVGYASVCLPFDVELNDGVEAHAVTATSTDAVVLKAYDGIKAGQGAILVGTPGKHTVNIAETAEWTDNLLEGTTVATEVEGKSYILANGDNGIGLYSVELANDKFTNGANKAYLPASKVANAAAAMFSFGRGEGTTGIETAVSGEQTAVIYDLAGRRVEKMEKGIYIVNGKKVIR